MTTLRVAVVGAGWAGLSAAVHATRLGHAVTLLEMAPQPGGRARSHAGDGLDNGQHILIGAYCDTLQLMRQVGVDPARVLLRRHLLLRMADGRELRLGGGPAALSFGLAVARCTAWTTGERLRLVLAGLQWAAAGFHCDPDITVDRLCAALPRAVRALLIDPLCVAALNTPAREASAIVFLRVLRDGLFGVPGASDLLLPRQPLQSLLPDPAARWLRRHGAQVHAGTRVQTLHRDGGRWQVDGQAFDHVVLACGALESARLARPWNATWAASAEALRFEPIVTVYVRHHGPPLPEPMLGLADGADAPAQFVFDQGQLTGRQGLLAFVISGAADWVEAGRDVTAAAVLLQAEGQLGPLGWCTERAQVVAVIAERRATFRATPALQRPPAHVAPGLWAAGDHVLGPYPATLEGAVRSGRDVALALPEPTRSPAANSTMQNRVSPG